MSKYFHRMWLALVVMLGFAQFSYAQYCTPVYTTGCGSQDDIHTFNLSGAFGSSINQVNTGCSTGGYANYTTTVPALPVMADSNYSGIINSEYSGSEYVRIWLDANNNNTFDASEIINSGVSIGPFGTALTPFTVHIPAGLASGTYRMRVRMVFNNTTAFDPCTSYTYGEVHDYNVSVLSATPCSGTPTAGTASASPSSICPFKPISLTLTGQTLAVGVTYKWYKSSTSTGPWTFINNNISSSSAFDTPSVTTFYKCDVFCGTSMVSSTVTSVTVATLFPAGTYTINSAMPTSGTNFQTFNAAVAAISCGTTGPVVFNVDPASGPYNEQVILPNIATNSATNTITFKGNGRVLNFAPTVNTQRATLFIDNGKYFIIDSLTINSTGSSYGYAVQLINNSDNNTLKNCTINASTTATLSSYSGIVISGSYTSTSTTGSYCDSNLIQNNTVNGGYYGISIVGNGTPDAVYGNKVIGNKVNNFYYAGIYNYSNAQGLISNNQIARPTRTSVGGGYGIMNYYNCAGTVVEKNRILDIFTAATTSTTSFYGIYNYNTIYISGGDLVVANNQVDLQSGGGTSYACYLYGDNVKILHNTFNVGSTTSTNTGIKAGLYLGGTSGGTGEFTNNIVYVSMPLATSGAKYCIYYGSGTYSMSGSKNWFYMNPANASNNFGYYNAAIATLSAFQAATGTQAGSDMVNPLYTSAPTNYTPMAYAYDNFGLNKGITTDYNNASRIVSTPDVGSLEFSAPPCTSPVVPGVAKASDTIICASFLNNFTLTGNSFGSNQTYTWQYSSTATGTYSNISAASISSSAQLPANSTGYYRCMVKCGTDSAYSVPVYVFTNPALSAGTYTINATAPASATNFTSFTNAASALYCGITGPIVINVVPGSGPYIEQVTFPQITGSSSSNTVTINGNGEKLVYFATSATAPSTVIMNGTDYLTLRNLLISATGTVAGAGVVMTNDANNNTIDSCIISIDSSLTSSAFFGIALSGATSGATFTDSKCDSNMISNNRISGGYYGISVYGTGTASPVYNNSIINNEVANQYYNGIRAYYTQNMVIKGNKLHRQSRTSGATYYGIYNYYGIGGMSIRDNDIFGLFDMNLSPTGSTYCIYMSNCDGTASNPNSVVNNEIYYLLNNSGSVYGLYLYSGNNVKVYHNTVNLDNVLSTATSGTIAGFYTFALNNSELKNNNFNITNAGTSSKYGYYFTGTTIPSMKNNNIYINSSDPNSKIGYLSSTGYATLAAWQTASLQDTNSVSIDPMISPLSPLGDMTPTNTSLNNLGLPVGVLKDQIGHVRSLTTPDIGSREFPNCTPANLNIASSDTTGLNTPCDNALLTLSVASGMTTYQWEMNGNPIPGATSSTYMPTMSGSYTVLMDSMGCIGSQSTGTNVIILSAPTVSAGVDDSICIGSTYTLMGSGANTYSWNNGITNGTPFTLNATNTYVVTGTAANGCKDTDTVMLYANPLPTANAGADQNVCTGTQVTLNGSGTGNISWNNGVVNNTPFTPAATNNTYVMTVTDPATGCINHDTVNVNVNSAPTLTSITATSNGPLGFTFTSNASNATTYAWTFGDGGTASTASPTHTYATAGLQSVTLTVSNSCGSVSLTREVPVAIENIASQHGFNIFPNPAKGKVTIVNNSGLEIKSMKMISALGSIIIVNAHNQTPTSTEISLDALSSGIYTLVLETDKGTFNQIINVIE